MEIITSLIIYGASYFFGFMPLVQSGAKKEAIAFAGLTLAAAAVLVLFLTDIPAKGPLMMIFGLFGEKS